MVSNLTVFAAVVAASLVWSQSACAAVAVNFIKDIGKDLGISNPPFVIGECGLCGPKE